MRDFLERASKVKFFLLLALFMRNFSEIPLV